MAPNDGSGDGADGGWDIPYGMRLHIGGQVRREGWTVLDALPGPVVDIVGDCRDLSGFGDGGCGAIYASHVLEHLAYDAELPKAIGEFMRLLAPGGLLLISVPDMDVLCRLFVDDEIGALDKFMVMRMIFGGRTTPFDVHYSGLNFAFLASFLKDAGFADVKRVRSLSLFLDASEMRFLGYPISVNLIARKPL